MSEPVPEARVVKANSVTADPRLAFADPREANRFNLKQLAYALGTEIAKEFADQVVAVPLPQFAGYGQVHHELALVVLRPSEFKAIVAKEAQKLLDRAAKL